MPYPPVFAERAFIRLLRLIELARFRARIAATNPVYVPEIVKGKPRIAMLFGNHSVWETIATIKSLSRFLAEPLPVQLHEDGSLSEASARIIQQHLPGSRIIYRKEADRYVTDYLKQRRLVHSEKLRQHFIFSLRLFDYMVYAEGAPVLQLDADILFFQHPTELLHALFTGKPVFNADAVGSYSVAPRELESFLHQPLHARFNAGLMAFRPDEDLAVFTEQFMEKFFPEGNSDWYLEQTIFASWMALNGGQALSPNYTMMYRNSLEKGSLFMDNTISQHYCSWARPLYYRDFNKLVYSYLQSPELFAQFYLKIIRKHLKI